MVPLNDKGNEITEEDDIFIDDPQQLVSNSSRSTRGFITHFHPRDFRKTFPKRPKYHIQGVLAL